MFRKFAVMLVSLMVLAGVNQLPAQGPPGPQNPPPPPTAGAKLDIIEGGTSATYRVSEQFVGVAFTNDAVGTTNLVTGTLTKCSLGPWSQNLTKSQFGCLR